jgi:hypothetical protein
MTDPDAKPDGQETVVLERRAFSRFKSQVNFVIVRTNLGERTAAIVENESQGGIGVRLEFRIGINANDTVDVIYRTSVLPAVVRYVEPQEDGTALAGLEWATTPAV